MTDRENFVTRWSRLKRETAKGREPAKDGATKDAATPVASEGAAPAGTGAGPENLPPSSTPAQEAQEPPFDPATLPPIESIAAGTDIRAFLQSGVPAELTKAALRKAWSADPAIRDFIEMAENQWDFTDPNSIPGFGSLSVGEATGDLVNQAMGKLPQAADPQPPPEVVSASPDPVPASAGDAGAQPHVTTQGAGPPEGTAIAPAAPDQVNRSATTNVAAMQHADSGSAQGDTPTPRRHGRALPK
jgi:uncharacterized protein DUF3306